MRVCTLRKVCNERVMPCGCFLMATGLRLCLSRRRRGFGFSVPLWLG